MLAGLRGEKHALESSLYKAQQMSTHLESVRQQLMTENHELLVSKDNLQRESHSQNMKLEAIQRWSAICLVWPWTLTYQKLLLCVFSQGQDLHTKNWTCKFTGSHLRAITDADNDNAGHHSTTTRETYRQQLSWIDLHCQSGWIIFFILLSWLLQIINIG